MRALLLLLAIAAGSAGIVQDQAKVGSLRFTPPKGWKATPESGPAAAIYTPPDLPSGKACTVKIFPDEVDKDGFRPWFNRKLNSTAMTKLNMLEGAV